ncbi:MAG: demethoxyubiquinone hydroxylase family protein [Pseudomonadota bacterium]
MTEHVPPCKDLPLSDDLIAELRSDHAGECGAVAIYTGILAVSGDAKVRAFATEHRDTERVHWAFFDEWLPKAHHSRLLPLWRAAGWLLGAFSALFGARAVFRTIAAVETFVEQHYLEQIKTMAAQPELRPLAAKLEQFCDEEVEHRDDASGRLDSGGGNIASLWSRIVGSGSSLGVAIAKRI